jgi:gliding motility-associated-like protein
MFTAQTVTLPTCNKANGAANGSIQLQTIDGNVPAPPATYTYVWSANARGQTTATVTGLSGGASNAEQYTYIVTDAKGCTATGDVYMSEPTEMGVTLTQLSQPLCSYSSEGSISYRARGGNGFDYTYRWSNAQTTTTTSATQIGIITGLPAGNFFCTVTDPRGCSLTDSKQILAPEPVDPPTVAATDITCQGKIDGRATGDAFGGTAPHTFVWSTGVTDVIAAGQISTISGLASGSYSVTMTDANGCTSTPTNFSINDGLLFQIRSITSSTIPCKGDQTGEATIRSYVNGAPAIIQWSNGFFGNPVSGLSVGTYNVTVTSVAGCTTTGSVEIKETGTALNPPVTKAESVRCYGERNGKLEIDNNQSYGGTPPYQYSFTDNAYSTRDTLLNNISAGYYSVYIRDALGCKNQVNAYVPGPEKMDVAIDPTSARINLGDSILLRTVLNFSTTSTPLKYNWSSYGLRDSIRCDTCASTYANPIEFRTYTVTVTDSKGCSTTKSVDVDVNTDRNVYIPTGFTPNGDKVNDVFYVQTGAGLKAQKAIRFGRIYDRWGGLVFEIENVDSNNELFGWRGTIKGQDAPSTTYVYVFEIEFLDGTVKLYKGNINLIR